MTALLAQIRGSLAFPDILVGIIIVVAVFAILYYSLNSMGVPISPVAMKILGIVVVAALAIFAIRFLLSL